MRLRSGALALVLLAVALPSLDPVRADHAPRERTVYFITDSVGRGTVPPFSNGFLDAFAGWHVDYVAFPALMVHQAEANNVRPTPAGAFGDVAVVALGYSQPARYPFWDPGRFDREIDSIIHAFEERGVSQVFWVTLREVTSENVPSASARRQMAPYSWYFPGVNERLRRATERHDNLTLIDWASVGDRPGLTYDAIHLNNAFGVPEFTSLVRRVVEGSIGRIEDGTITPVAVAGTGGVPRDAAAVALNLAVTDPRRGGFLTAYPCGEELPLAANLNFVADETVSAAAIVPVGADGRICIYNSAAAHLIVDVMGSFPAGGAFRRAGPTRLADTRSFGAAVEGGSELRVQLPATVTSASAAVLNITAIGGDRAGFVTAYRCGDPVPATSNLNFAAGSTTPNLAVVAPDHSGAVCVRPNQSAHLVVDLFGALSGSGVSLPGATRALDTRTESSGAVGRRVAGERPVRVLSEPATGVLLNVTAVDAAAAGFLAAYPCDEPRPTTANLNVDAGETRGNFVVARPSSRGDVCIFSNVGTDVVVDVLGSLPIDFIGLPAPVRAFDSRTL